MQTKRWPKHRPQIRTESNECYYWQLFQLLNTLNPETRAAPTLPCHSLLVVGIPEVPRKVFLLDLMRSHPFNSEVLVLWSPSLIAGLVLPLHISGTESGTPSHSLFITSATVRHSAIYSQNFPLPHRVQLTLEFSWSVKPETKICPESW